MSAPAPRVTRCVTSPPYRSTESEIAKSSASARTGLACVRRDLLDRRPRADNNIKSSRERNVKKMHFVGASLLALVVAGPALAQDKTPPSTNSAATVEEIIVTATKREQTLQDLSLIHI